MTLDAMDQWVRQTTVHRRFVELWAYRPISPESDCRQACLDQAVAEWDAANPHNPVPKKERSVVAMEDIV